MAIILSNLSIFYTKAAVITNKEESPGELSAPIPSGKEVPIIEAHSSVKKNWKSISDNGK